MPEVKCPNCEGSGEIRTHATARLHANHPDVEYQYCIDCMGSGTVDPGLASQIERDIERRLNR